jgi:hypothetical protein
VTLPYQGPREILRSRPVTPGPRLAIERAIGALEDAQMVMCKTDGDSKERTRVCEALELLYHLTVER